MGRSDRGVPQPLSDSGRRYFDFLAETGVTKHAGSLNATRELIALCRISKGQYVLDAGCGVGVTPCYLAKEHGCRVVGVDFIPKMVERSRERAEREGVTDLVEFRVDDARALSFEDNLFDAVLCESVVMFMEEKQRAVNEFARVTKPGGYVGLTETTLLKPSPPAEVIDYMSETAGMVGVLLLKEDWEAFLHNAGLGAVIGRAHQMELRKEAKARLERYGMRDILAALGRLPGAVLRDPSYKGFLGEALGGTKYLTQDVLEYVGYGIYVGRK